MALVGFYSGSFDPVTKGHEDIIVRALGFLDELVIGVGVHHAKAAYLTGQERVDLLQPLAGQWQRTTGKSVKIVQFSGLAVDAAKENEAKVIIRGLRDSADFSYEMQMAGMNLALTQGMAQGIETIFLPSQGEVRHIAAKLVRQIEQLDGDITSFVSPHVASYLRDRNKNEKK